jgi:N-terminal acetyltransferase B complex non-catalytic subunit
MARYPTFEEYQQRGNYTDGIKRCDDLLKKNSNDVQLLTVKLQLLYAIKGDTQPVLDQLLAIQPPIQDLRELVAIEEAVVESQTGFPIPRTAGPAVAKLWENASKTSSSMNYKLDLHSLRFSRAIVNNRLQDAQQALIQLKALQPKNRVIYMAHLAITQLLSTSKDDLQSKLSISLARKAVAEKFDEDKTLDCRVPGQIFAIQSSTKDLESIAARPFKESKQVHDALRKEKTAEVNGLVESKESKDSSTLPPSERLVTEVEILKNQFRDLVETSAKTESILQFAKNAIRLFYAAESSLVEDRRRVKPDACFLSISALIRVFEQTDETSYLLQSAYLAKTLLQQNEHIHEAKVILIYLYMRLGLGSLALRMWHDLSIKEIQHDTVGHVLFTRLSLTHPAATKLDKKKQIDPLERLSHALGVYSRHEEKLAETEASVLSHGQTGMIFDLQELRDSLRSSLTRRIIHLERTRLGRLLNSSTKDDLSKTAPSVTADWLTFTDTRDFATTFNYGYNVERVLQSTNRAIPRRGWLLYTLALEQAHLLAAGPTSAQKPVVDVDSLIEEFEKLDTDMKSLRLDDDTGLGVEMRDSEYLTGDLACQVLKILTPSHAKLADGLAAVKKGVGRLNVEALVQNSDGLAETLVEHYLYLDVLQLVVKTCNLLEEQEQEGGEQVEVNDLVELCKAHQKSIVAHAKEQAKRVKAADVREALARDSGLLEGLMLFGEGSVKSFCDSVAESAREGWAGLAKVDIKMK